MNRYRWRPVGGSPVYNPADLAAGQIIAIDCDGLRHRPWRVETVRLADDDRYSIAICPHGVDLASEQAGRGSVSIHRHGSGVYLLDERYPVCSHCHELMPCSDTHIGAQVEADARRTERFETPGICPACLEPVTGRQQSVTFGDNLHVPLGPPVTFHTRTRCFEEALRYDEQVAESTGCRPELSCAGTLTRHVGLSAECSELRCPGNQARHARVAHCSGRRFCPRCRELDTTAETTPASPDTIRAIRARKDQAS